MSELYSELPLSTHSYYDRLCNTCTIYVALFLIDFLIIQDISGTYLYFQWYLKRDNHNINTGFNTNIDTGNAEILVY